MGIYKTEEELLCDFRTCKKCRDKKHVLEMKIFITGEVSKYCKGCYVFKPYHTNKIFYKHKHNRKHNFLKFKSNLAIKMPKNFDTVVNNSNN